MLPFMHIIWDLEAVFSNFLVWIPYYLLTILILLKQKDGMNYILMQLKLSLVLNNLYTVLII